MSEVNNDVYVDIPYITEDLNLDERSLSKEESAIGPWYTTESRNHSDSPSPCSSFRDDRSLLTRKHTVPFVFVSGHPYRTSSLDDIRRGKKNYCACPTINRHGYGRRSQRSEYNGSSRAGSSRRKGSTTSDVRGSSFRSSVRSNRSRKSSNGLERSRSIKSSRRASNNISPPVRKTEAELKREKRHRIAVWLVLGSFLFIAISSILVVIITLTHQSEHSYDDNNTLVYYTFARPSHLP